MNYRKRRASPVLAPLVTAPASVSGAEDEPLHDLADTTCTESAILCHELCSLAKRHDDRELTVLSFCAFRLAQKVHRLAAALDGLVSA